MRNGAGPAQWFELRATTPLISKGLGWRHEFHSKKQKAMKFGGKPRYARIEVQVRGACQRLQTCVKIRHWVIDHAIHASHAKQQKERNR
jgi:hypothetical protein